MIKWLNINDKVKEWGSEIMMNWMNDKRVKESWTEWMIKSKNDVAK